MAMAEQPYSAKEVARRRDELAKRMLSMPPKPLVKREPKPGAPKKRGRPKKSPGSA